MSRAQSPALSPILAEHLAEFDRLGGQRVAASIDRLGEIVRTFDVSRVLLVLDRGAVDAIGIDETIRAELTAFDVEPFDAFSPNPRWEEGLAAAVLAASHRAQLVVAVGGGSCLDVAKMAALAANTPDIADSLIRGEDATRARPLPIVAAPTTSGTGSEATHFAAIYVNGRKVSVAHPALRPAGVVLDPTLHEAMPAHLAACSGLDALGQAMESAWSVGCTDASLAFAERAGELIRDSLVESVRSGTRSARERMMLGAHLAGRAINISKTTVSHALSYQFTQMFGLSHGHAVALTLGHAALGNAGVDGTNCADPRGPAEVRRRVEIACGFLGASPTEAPRAIRDLLGQLGLPATLAEAGVDASALGGMAERVDPVRLGNNPRRLSADELREMLERAW